MLPVVNEFRDKLPHFLQPRGGLDYVHVHARRRANRLLVLNAIDCEFESYAAQLSSRQDFGQLVVVEPGTRAERGSPVEFDRTAWNLFVPDREIIYSEASHARTQHSTGAVLTQKFAVTRPTPLREAGAIT